MGIEKRIILKKSLKIPKGYSKAINRRTDNTTARRIYIRTKGPKQSTKH
jgi:hypothetical protein